MIFLFTMHNQGIKSFYYGGRISHTPAVPSAETDTRVYPSGENDNSETRIVWSAIAVRLTRDIPKE